MGQGAALNRREFLVRGGAAGLALGLFAQLPASARAAGAGAADRTGLTDSEYGVIGGLVGAICLANQRSFGDAAALGLMPPEAFAEAYAGCATETRTAISAVLAAVEQGPLAQLFSTLEALAQAEFIGGVFAKLELYAASDRDGEILDSLSGSTNALVASLHPALLTAPSPPQPAFAAPQIEPFAGAADGQYIFAQTLLCALTLVSEPLLGETPAPESPTLSDQTATALAEWLSHRSVGSQPPTALVSAITTELNVALPAQIEHRVYPCVALSRALTLWLSLGVKRISL